MIPIYLDKVSQTLPLDFGLFPHLVFPYLLPIMVCLLKHYYVAFYVVPLLGLGLATTVQAQSITAADQATTIQHTGNTYQINGGNLSADSTVLFHSFDQFGLLTQEAALFSNPVATDNIIGRVVGGDASIIDGLLAVDGNANLYLVNPAGVLFGENAQLNLDGSFSASTATGLIFGDELFDVLGSNNNFNLLSGVPTGYVFGNQTASAVVNAGNLAVDSGQSLTLLGGQVINTGQLSAPNGEILVMAVPGENLVRISQPGSLLSLELASVADTAESAFAVSTVPALLAGASDLGMATDIMVNPDGTVSLTGSSLEIPVDDGTTIVAGQLTADEGGDIAILGEKIALVGASVDASGETGGGTVLVGGDWLGASTVPQAATTVADETSVIRADAQDDGDGGTIVTWGTDLLRTTGQLSSRGGANGGDGGLIETSGLGLLDIRTTPDVTAANGAGGLWLLDPANIRIVAGTGATNVSPINPFDVGILTTDALLGVDLIEAALAEGGNVEVQTTGDTPGDGNIILEVPLDYHLAGDGSLTFRAEGEIQILADISDSQDIIVTLDPITEGILLLASPDNLDLTLQANEQITITGNISTGAGTLTLESQQENIAVSGALSTSSGDVMLQAPQGAIDVSTPIQTSLARLTAVGVPPTIPAGGDVMINAQNAISVGNISTGSDSVGGNLLIESQASSINVGEVDTSISMLSSFPGQAGTVDLIAQDNIVFSSIDASSPFGNGGDVTIDSSEGLVLGIGTVLPSFNTITTEGGEVDGNITIFHDGGSTGTSFVIGGTSENGTAGDLATGTLTLTDITLEESFKGGLDVGNIDIITSESPDDPDDPDGPDDPDDILEELEEILDETDCDCLRNESTSDIDPTVDMASVDMASENLPVVAARPGIASLDQHFLELEDRLTTEFNDYLQLGTDLSTETVDLASAQSQLLDVEQKTGKTPALIYAVFGLDGAEDEAGNVLANPKPSAPLELLLITATGDPIFVPLDVTRQEILTMAQRLRRQVSTPSRAVQQDTSYLVAAQELYQWLIMPLQPYLEEQNIDTISFVTDAGLRSLPLAALHDGENFIIQNYNIGLMPSLSLTDLTYQDISNTSALVAGTSTFVDQAALPGVPVELDAIASTWNSKILRGNAFRIDQLRQERQQSPHGIIHLATHGEFNVGDLSKSSLSLYNERLSLDQLRSLDLNRPSVELLTLSACQTALGNRSAELGFAGFAVLAGAKTSIASLWSVSDEASAGLMIELYRQLQENQPIIKAEALRRAQLAMIRGDISVEGDQLKGLGGAQKLPIELAIEGEQDFSHPYYWAAFSLVGSPW